MIKEQSYGIVPLHKCKDGTIEILIVKWSGYRWFPKWHIEKGEQPVHTAVRELQEETWIKNVIVDESKIFKDHYMFTFKKNITDKYVWFFIAHTSDKKVHLQRKELSAYRRVPLADAKNLLTYESEKKIFDEVVTHLWYEKYVSL